MVIPTELSENELTALDTLLLVNPWNHKEIREGWSSFLLSNLRDQKLFDTSQLDSVLTIATEMDGKLLALDRTV